LGETRIWPANVGPGGEPNAMRLRCATRPSVNLRNVRLRRADGPVDVPAQPPVDGSLGSP
jgi:hypothetical protein